MALPLAASCKSSGKAGWSPHKWLFYNRVVAFIRHTAKEANWSADRHRRGLWAPSGGWSATCETIRGLTWSTYRDERRRLTSYTCETIGIASQVWPSPHKTSLKPLNCLASDPIWDYIHIHIHRVSEKKTSTHIIGYNLRNSCLILIIFDTKIPHIIWHRETA